MASQAIQVAKKAFRPELKKILDSISAQERAKQSALITKKLLSHERFLGCHRVSIYVSMDEEPDTRQLIEHTLKSGQECFIPKYDAKTRNMDMVRLYSMEEYNNLPYTSWNIKQPQDDKQREEALSTGGLDLVIVPGLAFTRTGQRIGRGRGYYDHYFDKCDHDPHGRPYIIGLAFRQQIFRSIPTDDYDVKLDEVIYPDVKDMN